ncbi:MAG: hypothetical protein WD361_14390 [Gracilimonas sp.]
MHTDENKAIRYLMKEMDPSEEMEFEKIMRENENLLIEVESLRATKRKLSALPRFNPPEQLTKKIANDAKQLQIDKLNKAKNIAFFLKRGLAAAILLSAFTGGYYYYADYSEAVNETGTTIINGTDVVEPWVDRNDVIRFSENPAAVESSVMQSEFTRSYEKLQLVNDLTGNISGNNGIMLTRSPN